MGGMFTVLKVRKDQAPNDYKNSGWFKQPPGTRASEWKGTAPTVKRSNNPGESAMKRIQPKPEVEVHVKKPGANNHKH
jgi:hypothetical protein